MLEFKYEIKIDENGQPYTSLSKEYEENPEDKFMLLDLCSRMLLNSVRNGDLKRFSEDEKHFFIIANKIIHILKIDAGNLLKKRMDELGVTELLNKPNDYHIEVSTIVNRDALNYNGIFYEDKIYKRVEGLRVLVIETMEVYELTGGIDNNNWVKVSYNK
jgi:hypothetical protein